MIYAKAFFDLQLRFAHRVTALCGLPLARALLEYTNLYIRFGLGHDFDPAHPTWREYVAGLEDANDNGEWTYAFYLKRPEVVVPPNVVATFGCFSYARLSDDRLRLHFHHAEPGGQSPLAIERVGERRKDLAAFFEHVKRTRREPVQVIGASWLYNIDAYRRLFPPSYLATAHVIDRFRHMPLWGAVSGPAWRDQRDDDASVPGAARAAVESREPGPVLSLSGARTRGFGAGVL